MEATIFSRKHRARLLVFLTLFWVSGGAHATPPIGDVSRCPGLRTLGTLPSGNFERARGQKGYFVTAASDRLNAVERRYVHDKTRKGGLNLELDGTPERFQRRDLDLNLDGKLPTQIDLFRASGLKALGPQKTGGAAKAQLSGTAFEGFSPLHHFTSGAGLWSRGGGTVKGLLPLNLKELVSPKDFHDLVLAGEIAAAKGPAEVLRLSGHTVRSAAELENPESPASRQAEALSRRAQETIRRITSVAMADPRTICAIDMKLVNVAMLSRKTKAYVHFDVWTSEQTHDPIFRRFEYLKANFRTMTFHPDKQINDKIHAAMADYFAADRKLGETHLFGYQVGVYPLDPATGASLKDHVAIGEGAGMAKRYLNESGRTAMLVERGVKDWSFHNIEIVSDIGLEYGAYRVAGKPVAAILVPTQPGYSGGSPYLIRRPDGSVAKQLVEGSAVSADLRENNSFFNTNSIYQSMDIEPPENVGYETKNNGRIVRLKMNAGDITLSHPTAMIGGRLKKEYENFKTYAEYGSNGGDAIKEARQIWKDYATSSP